MLTVRVIRQCGGERVDTTRTVHDVTQKGRLVSIEWEPGGAVQVFDEGEFFVMNDQGKTVATYRLPGNKSK
jgi:hypothetical protein